MKITGPQIISELRKKLQFDVGRHLYGVLGTYAQLARFEKETLAQALDPQGRPFPPAINLNRDLPAQIPDDDLRRLIRNEARYPQTVQRRLNKELNLLLHRLWRQNNLLILKQLGFNVDSRGKNF